HRPRRESATPESPAPPSAQNGHAPLELWLAENDDESGADGDGTPEALNLAFLSSSNGMHPEDAAGVLEEPRAAPSRAADRQASLPLGGPGGEADNEDGPVFRARLFGTFRVETDAGEVDGWSIQKARELLAYLLAHGGTPVLR